MAVKTHGTRSGYNGGCRCAECKAFVREYARDYRRRKLAGDPALSTSSRAVPFIRPPVVEEPDGPGRVESAVIVELEGLVSVQERPGLTETALALARILDNPRQVGQQPAAAARLADILRELRKGADVRRSRLASVRAMTSVKSATG